MLDVELDRWRKNLDRLLTEHQGIVRDIKTIKKAIKNDKIALGYTQGAQKLCQEVAQQVQNQVSQRIAKVVTRCLEAVYEQPYSVEIKFEQKRGKTEAVVVLYRDGLELDDPLHQAGGGVCDMIGFAQRLACLCLSHPAKRKLLVQDEPFKFLDKECRPRAAQLIRELAQELGIQFIMATHIPDLCVGNKVYDLGE
jgi:DNA repair exonuclease SbcCD ATPase subunit